MLAQSGFCRFVCAMMNWVGKRIGWARIIALALVVFAMAVRVSDPLPVQIARNLTFDLFQQIEPRKIQPYPVAILDVDDSSIAEIGQWPWPRTVIADLVDKAMHNGAVAIAFDIIFAEPDRLSPQNLALSNPSLPDELIDALEQLPQYDAQLAAAFARGRVIVGQTSVRSARSGVEATREIVNVPHALVGPDPTRFITSFPELLENLPELEAAAVGRGVFNVRPDPDGVYRRAPIVVKVQDRYRLGLASELLRVATGGQPFAIRSNEAGIDGVVLAGKIIRTAADGTVRPYFTPSDRSRYVSVADLLNDRVPQGRLNGHLLLVGTSAIGLEDYRTTPLGVQMAGVEIHAQLLENILSDTLLNRPNYTVAVELVSAFVICLILIILTPIMNATILIASTLLFLTTIGLGAFNLFSSHRILIDPSFPIWAGLATIIFMSAANYLREERQRRQIRQAFGQYVSKDLVDALNDSQEQLALGGETRELTLLLSDVRGFTAIAESFRDDPAGLTRLMNRFLNLLSNAILDSGGTIDKFMGDAVMAFWNAPMDHDDHQRSACAAALRMIADVETLNQERQKSAEKEGRTILAIEVGIGINTGICMVGNMGSDMRFDYTAMGDPVNLASRLEGQSRNYGTSIIVGSATRDAVDDDFALLELDLIRVKGRSQPELVYALIGDKALRDSEEFQLAHKYNAMLNDAYSARDWDRAEAALSQLEPLALALDSRLKLHLEAYSDRIRAFRENPPPPEWEGVFEATSK